MINCEIIVGQVGRRCRSLFQRTAWTVRFSHNAIYGHYDNVRLAGWIKKFCVFFFSSFSLVFLLYQFGKVNDFLCVDDFGAVAQPVSDVRLVHEAPPPLLRQLAGVAVRDKHRLGADVHLHAVIVA